MRKIKFRTWNKNIKKFTYFKNESLLHDLSNIIHLGFEAQGPVYMGEYDGLEEYTGIKADNGIEIYEGDIVIKTPRLVSNVGPFKGVVKFDECAYWVDNGEDAELLFTEVDDIEIVGNIYENPELLEG